MSEQHTALAYSTDVFDEEDIEDIRQWYREQLAFERLRAVLPEAREYERWCAQQRRQPRPRRQPRQPADGGVAAAGPGAGQRPQGSAPLDSIHGGSAGVAPPDPETSPAHPEWLSTRVAARHLHVRNETLYEAAEEGIEAGLARITGGGGARRHVRWLKGPLADWWKAKKEAVL